jgi:hypothetical protein
MHDSRFAPRLQHGTLQTRAVGLFLLINIIIELEEVGVMATRLCFRADPAAALPAEIFCKV